MKYAIECNVKSHILIKQEISITHEDKTYIFMPDEKGLLKSIKIIMPVKNPNLFYSSVEPSPNKGIKLNITIQRDNQLSESIIREFQELESTLSFNGSLRKIYWNEPKEDLIFDNEEERKKAQIYGTHFSKSYPITRMVITPEQLAQIIGTKDRYASLSALKSFFREGKNEFEDFRYINAFFNFYFVLEGVYGNGKTKNVQVEHEFNNSKEFVDCINKFIRNNLIPDMRHYKNIEAMLKHRNKKVNEEGIIHLLVSTRGELHHFANNPNKVQGTPFNHEYFESIAWMTLGFAVFAIAQKIVEINQSFKQKEY